MRCKSNEMNRIKLFWRISKASLMLAWTKSPLRLQLRGLGLWLFVQIAPKLDFKLSLMKQLSPAQLARLNLYCQINEVIDLPDKAITAQQLTLKKYTHYVSDLLRVLTPYFLHKRFLKEFGDVTWVPEWPTFVKSRPIGDNNQHAVLLPMNARRHFVFPSDPYDFHEKASKMMWRGAALQIHRKRFLDHASRLPFCDVGDPNYPVDHPQYKSRMSVFAQMRFKYLISLEGNDVASNLKWIMNSNSLCLMPKPRYETWFLESQLQAGVHYVELEDDFGNLQAVFDHFEQHPEEAIQIIQNAQNYVAQFKNARSERLLTLAVAQRYFHSTR